MALVSIYREQSGSFGTSCSLEVSENLVDLFDVFIRQLLELGENEIQNIETGMLDVPPPTQQSASRIFRASSSLYVVSEPGPGFLLPSAWRRQITPSWLQLSA